MQIMKDDIINAKADVIICAANGVGWMGGNKKGLVGIAESLNSFTNGKLEKDSLLQARIHPKISSWILGHKPGSIFTTDSYELNCKRIIHAVTMRYPASKSKYRYIKKVLQQILEYCDIRGYLTIAMPLLGCGTGGLQEDKTLHIIEDVSSNYPYINIKIYKL